MKSGKFGMRMLIGTHKALLLWVDGQTYVLHEGLGAYYGITWDDRSIYVVARGSMPSRMLAFDSHMRPILAPPFINMGSEGYSGPHQALYSRGVLYVVNTQRNRVECWDGEVVFNLNWAPTYKDRDHINSIWREPQAGTLWITEHRKTKRPKKIRVLEADHTLLSTIELDPDFLSAGLVYTGIHNVYIEDGILYTLGPSQVVTYDLDTLEVDAIPLAGVIKGEHYLRGLARSDDHFYIGASRASPRDGRAEGASRILVTNDRFGVLEANCLSEDYGALYEIRLVDLPDRAHNGLPCPLI